MPTASLLLDIYDADAAGIVTAARLQRTPLVERLAQLDAERAEIQAKIDAVDLEAQLALDAARWVLLDALYVKLDSEGSPVPRPGAPTGPRKRKEPEAPKEPTTPTAPQEPASAGQGDGFALFSAAVSDRGADEPIATVRARLLDPAISDWTEADLLAIGDEHARIIDRHALSSGEVAAFDAGMVRDVRGKWWTMGEPARVTA